MRGELWIKVSEITAQTGVPETTVRRFFASFRHYFPRKRRGKAWLYPSRSVELVRTIKALYDAGKSTDDVEAALAVSVSAIVDVEPDKLPRVQPSPGADRELLLATLALLDQRQKVEQLEAKLEALGDQTLADRRAIVSAQETIRVAQETIESNQEALRDAQDAIGHVRDTLESIEQEMARKTKREHETSAWIADRVADALDKIKALDARDRAREAEREADRQMTLWQAFKRLFKPRK